MEADSDVTRLLSAWQAGDPGALDELTPIVYEELRRLAEKYMRREASGHTLEATALVHEAYARLASSEVPLRNRAHFLAFMARLMRQVLVDHARARKSAKRGEGLERVTLDESIVVSEDWDGLVLELDEVLEELRGFDELKCQIIELRFFGGLTYEEAAAALDISTSTLDRELRLAKAWLRHRMRQQV
jgi:RNA polymerase sigma factor (TIGR02999 family)